jgi:hypothetical protein
MFLWNNQETLFEGRTAQNSVSVEDLDSQEQIRHQILLCLKLIKSGLIHLLTMLANSITILLCFALAVAACSK